MPRKSAIGLFAAVVLLAIGGLLFRYALPGLSSARPTPPTVEIAVATWLLLHSVPAADAERVNPLSPTEAGLAAGAALFQRNCAVCHGFDGGGRTTIGTNVYPRAPALRQALPALTDGQVFSFVHDGIRNTAMPAWHLPDNDIWQIVLFLRHLPPTAAREAEQTASVGGSHYVGSAACQSCHRRFTRAGERRAWPTSCAIPATHPEAIIPDFSKPDPLLTFTKDDIAFVYGSQWKQRYFTKRGDDYFPLPAQWDITNHALARLSRRRRTARLVGAVLSRRRQHAAPDRPALRRLPLGELRHRDQDRRPNGTSAAKAATAPGSEHVAQPDAIQHRQSGAARLCRTPTTPASSAIRRASP